MPQSTLTASNIRWQNLNIGVANQALTVPLPQAFAVQDAMGQIICDGTKQMNGARLAIRGIFADPRPANLPGGPAPLAVGNTVDWAIQGGNFVINAVVNGGAAHALPAIVPVPVPLGGAATPQIQDPEVSADALRRIGFRNVAKWRIQQDELEYVDIGNDDWRNWSPALYAHCEGEFVRYIGTTRRRLSDRMDDYRRGLGDATNARVHNEAQNVIQQGGSVTILGFCPDHHLEWGGFPINLPAALEDILIDHFKPAWNA